MVSALPSWAAGDGLLSHGEVISRSLQIVTCTGVGGHGRHRIHGLLGFKNAPTTTSRAWQGRGMRGCRISLRREVSLTVTPLSLLPSTQWDQARCLKLLSLWKEKWMLCPVWRAVFVVADLLHPISIRWNVARDVVKCKIIRENYDLYQPQRLKLS